MHVPRIHSAITTPPMGDRLGVAVGLMGSEDPADSAFYESKEEETTKSPPIWPSKPSYGGAKISGDPVQSVCSQGILTVSLLRAFSGVDTGAPGIKSDWCIYGIRAVYGCLAI